MDILLAPANWPFSAALGLMAFGVIGQLVASGLGEAADALHVHDLPEVGGDFSHAAGADFDGAHGAWAGALDWLGIGKLPLFLLLSLFFAIFGLVGLTLQTQFQAHTGSPLPVATASAATLFATLPLLKLSGALLRPLLPRDETEAVSPDSFLGAQAIIEIGVARRGQPTQARLKDKFGHTHFVLVEPQNSADEFPAGSIVLLVQRQNHAFFVIAGVKD